MTTDERGFIVGWLAKLVIGFVLVAIVLFDGGSIFVNFFTLDGTADEIANTVSVSAVTDRNISDRVLEEEAKELADEAGARLVSFERDRQESLIRLTLRRRAKTLVVGRIGYIEDWARATAEGQAGTRRQ